MLIINHTCKHAYEVKLVIQVYVFAKADDLKSLLEPLEDIARKFKAKVLSFRIVEATEENNNLLQLYSYNVIILVQIMFTVVDIADEDLAKPFLTLFGLEESKNTVVRFQY